MAVGPLYWVAGISLLLVSWTDCAGAAKTSGRFNAPAANLLDDGKDFSDGLSLDEGAGEVSSKKNNLMNEIYKKAPPAQPLTQFLMGQNLAANQASHTANTVINGAKRQWESNSIEPLTFPLQVKQVQFSPQLQSPVVKLAPYPTNVGVSPPSSDLLTPVSTDGEQGPEKPSGISYQQVFTRPTPSNAVGPGDNSEDPLSLGSNMVEPQSGYKLLPLEQLVPQFAPESLNPSQTLSHWSPQEWYSQGNEIESQSGNYAPWKPSPQVPKEQSFYPSLLSFPYSGAFPGGNLYKNVYQPRSVVTDSKRSFRPQVGSYSLPPSFGPPRRRFFIRSKSAYQRRRFMQSKTTYTPDYEVPKPTYTKSVKVYRAPARHPNKPSVPNSLQARKA